MIHQPPMMRLDDFHDQLHHRRWRKKLTAPLTLSPSEVAKKVFVNLAELVALRIDRNLREVF
jgi:hypothetical protein